MRPFNTRQALDRHTEIGAGLVSVRDLSERFGTGDSVAELLRQMGPFVAADDAFQFENDFPINADQAGDFLDTVPDPVIDAVVEKLVGRYVNALGDIDLNPLPILENHIPDVVIDLMKGSLTRELIERIADSKADPVGSNYGRCGGMAFAGYDFYLAGRPIDTTVTAPPAEGPLGEYIYQRLLDSLRLNVGTFVEWLVDLHLLAGLNEFATATLEAALGNVFGGPAGTAILAFIKGQTDVFDPRRGPEVLRDPTKREWTRLKEILDIQAAWPVGLIYGDKPLLWDQHQVLAIGYTDGAGLGELIIWDNERGNKSDTMELDFHGSELVVSGSNLTVKGFFHERYIPQQPPKNL